MPLSRELVRAVRSRLAEQPEITEEQLATELNASEAEVITAFPVSMRRRAKNSEIATIWKRATRWKHVSISFASAGHAQVLFISPTACPDSRNSSFGTQLTSGCGQRGSRPSPEPDITSLDIGSVWFVSRPVEKAKSHAIHLYNKSGTRLLSLYLGCDYKGGICPEDMADYELLREHYGVTPRPRIQCKGCPNCTCQKGP